MKPIQTFSCIGAGQVAQTLSEAFVQAGLTPLSIWNREPQRARTLAHRIGAQAVEQIGEITPQSDLTLIAVSDDALETILPQLPSLQGVIAHCAGLKPIHILKAYGAYQAVIYPVQSFSPDRKPDLLQTPFCLEVTEETTKKTLTELIQKISPHLYWYSSEQRARIHLAAVWANNFSNAMYRVAADLLQEQDLPFDLLRPLILEGALKCQNLSPDQCQSGPAKRGDQQTMERHGLELSEPMKELYQKLSELIRSQEQRLPYLNHGKPSYR